ncbi:hypothetical protein [Neolewinella persica]|uniref:hypothetical protein n=1 Tax=Neolewinella persica TaxID=70998 RepID=UPI0003652F99|nr:hypothetical protein [Neolewinella persica]
MESTKSDGFRGLSIIAFALMAGLALFAAVVTYLITSGAQVGSEAIISPQMDIVLVAGFGLMCLTMSRFVFSKILESTSQEQRQDYPTAIARYRTAIIVRLALLEGPGLFAAAFALVTGNVNLLLVTIFMVAMMWVGKPSETEFAEWRQK